MSLTQAVTPGDFARGIQRPSSLSPVPFDADGLKVRAAELWPETTETFGPMPHAAYNQRAWLRAVEIVRSTARGMQADQRVGRVPAADAMLHLERARRA